MLTWAIASSTENERNCRCCGGSGIGKTALREALPVEVTVPVILVESSMRWLLVSTSSSALITMSVPAAASLSYRGVVLMIAGPGLTLVTNGLLAAGRLGSRRTRSRYRAASREGNARAAGPRAVEGQESACRERQGAPPTSPPPAARPRQSPAEFRAGKAVLPGADRAPGLGVDLGEANQVTEFVELGSGDVAGGVLGDEDGVEDPEYLLVDPGQRAREAISPLTFPSGNATTK